MAEGLVLAVTEKLSKQYPRVVFHVTTGSRVVLLEALRARRIELGFVRMSEAPSEDDVHHEMLFEEPLVVVAGSENPWVRRRRIALAELVNEPWTWAPGAAVDSRVVGAFQASGLNPPRATIYAEAINMRTKLAANGRFLAVVPAYVMRFRAKESSLKVLPVELPMTHGKSGIMTLRNRTLSPLAQLFIGCAREIAAPPAKRPTPPDRAKKPLNTARDRSSPAGTR